MTPLRFATTSPHQDVKSTCTSKLSIMHGVQRKGDGIQPVPVLFLSRLCAQL